MNALMRQEIMTAPQNIIFQEIPIPEPTDNQVLLQIKRIGICGSDIHVYHGTHPYTKYPVTQGHELSAQIVKIGKKVTGFSIGQKVTIEPQVFCGQCYPCTHGKYNLCESLKVMGFQTTGAASEYFAVDSSKITILPDNISYDEGALIEPLAVTVHAIKRFRSIKDSRVAILGCGPIGILLSQAARAAGAKSVLVTDISEYRLNLAKKLGADYAINTKKINFGEALKMAFGPDKADVIYDCAGNNTSINQAIQYARKGSTIILVAVFGNMAQCDLAKLNDSELDLNTSMMYRHEDYIDAIKWVSAGKIQLKPMISKHFSFDDYLDAYKYIDNNRETTMKVIIDVDSK